MHDHLVRGQVRDRPYRPKPTAKGMCGSPRHKICTASLDYAPLIDGFIRRISRKVAGGHAGAETRLWCSMRQIAQIDRPHEALLHAISQHERA